MKNNIKYFDNFSMCWYVATNLTSGESKKAFYELSKVMYGLDNDKPRYTDFEVY